MKRKGIFRIGPAVLMACKAKSVYTTSRRAGTYPSGQWTVGVNQGQSRTHLFVSRQLPAAAAECC